MERVKIINPSEESLKTECYIGEKKLKNVMAADFHVGIRNAPEFTFEFHGLPDIDTLGNVQFEFTPNTVREAAAVIVKAFSDKRSVEYRAFVNSIASALKELPEESGVLDVSIAIADRLLGLEEK